MDKLYCGKNAEIFKLSGIARESIFGACLHKDAMLCIFDFFYHRAFCLQQSLQRAIEIAIAERNTALTLRFVMFCPLNPAR